MKTREVRAEPLELHGSAATKAKRKEANFNVSR